MSTTGVIIMLVCIVAGFIYSALVPQYGVPYRRPDEDDY